LALLGGGRGREEQKAIAAVEWRGEKVILATKGNVEEDFSSSFSRFVWDVRR